MPEPRYPLCRQTVTLYHADPQAETVTHTVVRGVFFDRRARMTHTGQGQSQASAFLLIIPERAARREVDYTLAPGDRVLPGEGGAVTWQDWDIFVPALVPGLCCVQYVDPKDWQGAPCHLEAGGWWTRSGSGAHSLTN